MCARYFEVRNLVLETTSETSKKYFPARTHSATFSAKFSDWQCVLLHTHPPFSKYTSVQGRVMIKNQKGNCAFQAR